MPFSYPNGASTNPRGPPVAVGLHAVSGPRAPRMIGSMPDRLHFTDSDQANELIASDPMALLIGFALDQQVSVQKAFHGPLALRERLGAIDAATLAGADLESA